MTTTETSTPVTERVRAGSFETSVIQGGPIDGPKILLLHDGAWGASGPLTWGGFLPRLTSTYRVIVPDLLGYGQADKAVFVDRAQHDFRLDHLSALLEILGVDEPLHIVGNSFGGAVALRSLARPGLLPTRTVTSIAGSGGPWRTPEAPGIMASWDGSREGLAIVTGKLIDPAFPGFDEHLDARFTSARTAGHYRSVVAPGAPLPAGLETKVDDPWPEQIRGLEVPTLLVRCIHDELLEPEWADHVHAALPNSRIAEVNARHSPQIDAPGELESILLPFLAEFD